MYTEGKQKNKEQTPACGQTMVNTAVCNLVSKFGGAAQSCGFGPLWSPVKYKHPELKEDNDGTLSISRTDSSHGCMWSVAEKNLTFHS